MYSDSIRELTDISDTPNGEPKRYKNAIGYIRLRWKVGKGEYVEAYEHRFVMGLPAKNLEVHHINHVKDDNRPDNLVILSKVDHAKLHAKLNQKKFEAAKAKRNGYRSVAAYQKAERRKRRETQRAADYQEMQRLYQQGYSTIQIGEVFGIDSSNVSRHLRQIGTTMRLGANQYDENRPTK